MNTTMLSVNVGELLQHALKAEKFNQNNFQLSYDLATSRYRRAEDAGVIGNELFSHHAIARAYSVIGSFYLKKVESKISVEDFLRKLRRNHVYRRPADLDATISFVHKYPTVALAGRLTCLNTDLGFEDDFPPVVCFEHVDVLFKASRLESRTLSRGDVVLIQRSDFL